MDCPWPERVSGLEPELPLESVTFDPRLLAARWYARRLFPEGVPQAAADALEAGFDGPALRRLAGLIRPTLVDIQPWIENALEEIGQVEPLSQEEGLIAIAEPVARHIVDGSLDPLEGCRRLAAYAMAAGYPACLVGFFQIDDEPIWGEYARDKKAREKDGIDEARRFLEKRVVS